MRAFAGFRDQPPEEYQTKQLTNGGAAPDYQGVIFDDGTVAVRWMTAYGSHVIWPDYETFYAVHGHPEYGTRIVWYAVADEQQTGLLGQAMAALHGMRAQDRLRYGVCILDCGGTIEAPDERGNVSYLHAPGCPFVLADRFAAAADASQDA